MAKKFFLTVILFSFLALPLVSQAFQIVPCHPVCDENGNCYNKCTINDFFIMLDNVYTFIVKMIAAPLAVIAIIVSGFMMLTSAGNPNQFAAGKQILTYAIIGLVLAFLSAAIIRTILVSMGYKY